MSFRQPEVQIPKDVNSNTIGDCYTDALDSGKKCIDKAQTTFVNTLGDYTPIPEETIQTVKAAMKAAMQEKKEARRNKRRAKMNDRRNKRKNKRGRRNNRRDRR